MSDEKRLDGSNPRTITTSTGREYPDEDVHFAQMIFDDVQRKMHDKIHKPIPFQTVANFLESRTPDEIVDMWVQSGAVHDLERASFLDQFFRYLTNAYLIPGGTEDWDTTGMTNIMAKWKDPRAIGGLIRYQAASQSNGATAMGRAGAGHSNASAMHALDALLPLAQTDKILPASQTESAYGLPAALGHILVPIKKYCDDQRGNSLRGIEGYGEAVVVSNVVAATFPPFLDSLGKDLEHLTPENKEWLIAILHATQTFRHKIDQTMFQGYIKLYKQINDRYIRKEIFDIFATRLSGVRTWGEDVCFTWQAPLGGIAFLETPDIYTEGLLAMLESPDFDWEREAGLVRLHGASQMLAFFIGEEPENTHIAHRRTQLGDVLRNQLERDMEFLTNEDTLEATPSSEVGASAWQSIQERLSDVGETFSPEENSIRRIFILLQILDALEFDAPSINQAIEFLARRKDAKKVMEKTRRGVWSLPYLDNVNVHSIAATYTALLVRRFALFSDEKALKLLKSLYESDDSKFQEEIRAELEGEYPGGQTTVNTLAQYPEKRAQVQEQMRLRVGTPREEY